MQIKSKNGQLLNKPFIVGGATATLCLLVFLTSLSIGEPYISLADIYANLVHKEPLERIQEIVVYEIRMPRAIVALLAGMMLALAGSLLQDIFQNDLAGPELIGVSSGAAFVMAIMTVFQLPIAFSYHPVFAMFGGILSGVIVIFSASGKMDKGNFILIGTAVSAFLSSLVIIVISLGRQNDVSLLFFYLMGSLAGRNWSHVENIFPWFFLFVPVVLICARILNVMRLGDDTAKGVGINVVFLRVFLMVVAVALTAGVVANCGPIGYISLLAPHIAKKVLKTENAYHVLPVAGLLGSLILLSSDFLLRLILYPFEMPVGLMTTIIGGCVLLLFLKKRGRLT